MRMKCDVIKDLMPSYIDQLLSEESQCLVEEHLAECETCKAYYDCLKGDVDIFDAEEAEELHLEEIKPLKRIKKKMTRKTVVVSVVTAVCVICLLIGLGYLIFHHEHYVPYEEAGIRVTEGGNMYIDEEFYSKWEYTDQNRKLKFIYVTDSIATQKADRSATEKNQIIEDFNNSNTTYSRDDQTYKPVELEEVYYLSEEYAEKFKDRYFLLNETKEEEDRIYEEMKEASVLLWERPEIMKKTGTLSVRFTAKVESIINDPNLGEDAPRHVVARVFQSAPILFDAGVELGKELKVGETYTFNMELAMVEKPDEDYTLETLISLYDLRLESFSVVEEGLTGLDSVDIQYDPF